MNPGLIGVTVSTNSNAARRNHNTVYFVPHTMEPKQEFAGYVSIELNSHVNIIRPTPDVVDIKFTWEIGITEIDTLINKLYRLRDSMANRMEDNK